MGVLQNKIDFVMVVKVEHANPNGDPINGNMPRVTDDGLGEISDVCLKRKIRNRLLDMGESIFVQSDDKKADTYTSLRERANANEMLSKVKKDREEYARVACETWIDVRSFGQVFAFKADKGSKSDGVSVGVRGPVSIHPAFSVNTVDIVSTQITKSVNSEPTDSGKKSSDTMGMKHRIDAAVYVVKGSINVQLAEKTGFTAEDADKIKEALRTLFVNDASAARPDGSMEVMRLFWWTHNNKIGQYSANKVHHSVKVDVESGDINNIKIKRDELEGLQCEEYEGL